MKRWIPLALISFALLAGCAAVQQLVSPSTQPSQIASAIAEEQPILGAAEVAEQFAYDTASLAESGNPGVLAIINAAHQKFNAIAVQLQATLDGGHAISGTQLLADALSAKSTIEWYASQ